MAGATDSAPARNRNADQSANHAAAHTATPAANWKPGSTGAGATTSLKRFQAWSSAVVAACHVSVVGRPKGVDDGSSSQDSTSTPPSTAMAAVSRGGKALRRHTAASPWLITAMAARGGRNDPSR